MARRAAASKRQEELDQAPAEPHLKVVDHTTYASADDVKDFAEGLKEAYLLCRELGHNWRPLSASANGTGGGYHRVLRCPRCRTRREEELDSHGMKDGVKYVHPEGYLMEGLGRIVGEGRGLLRLESLRRTLEDI